MESFRSAPSQHSPSSDPPGVFKELESAHWVRKMKTLFRVMDTDRDGFVTLEDNQTPPKRMIEAFRLSKEKADAVLDYTRRVGWIELVNAGTEPPEGHRVSEEMFVENMARAVNSQDVAVPLAESHVVLFDLREQGFITKEEYLKVFRSLAVPEELSVQQFEVIDSDNDGRITVDDYTKVFRFFFTDLEHADDIRNSIFGQLVSKELESAHWVRKMKTLFRVMDTDHDGFITLEDNQAPPKRMIEAFNLSKEKADAVLDYTRRVGWIELVNAGTEPQEGHRISEEMFVENMARAVNSQDVAVPLAESHVVLFDLREQGFITKEEYLKVFRSLAVPEELSVQQFEVIDSDSDGRITVDDYTRVFRFFFTDLEHADDIRNNIFGQIV